MLEYKTIEQFSAESGYTPKAIRNKIDRGEWQENIVWRKAPDGRVLVSTIGFNAWVEKALGYGKSRTPASKSNSFTRGSGVGSELSLSLIHISQGIVR